jgi:hypothetical protein
VLQTLPAAPASAQLSGTAEPPTILEPGAAPLRKLMLAEARRPQRVSADVAVTSEGATVANFIEWTARPTGGDHWSVAGNAVKITASFGQPRWELDQRNERIHFGKEVSGDFQLTRAGRFAEIHLALPSESADAAEHELRLGVGESLSAIAENLLALGVMMPAEPVGRGAHWRSVSTLTKRNERGVGTAETRIDYRLGREMAGMVEIDFQGEMKFPALPAGQIERVEARMSGSIWINRNLPLPSRLSCKSQLRSTFTDGKTLEMNAEITLTSAETK